MLQRLLCLVPEPKTSKIKRNEGEFGENRSEAFKVMHVFKKHTNPIDKNDTVI